jgi:hypothetical protein
LEKRADQLEWREREGEGERGSLTTIFTNTNKRFFPSLFSRISTEIDTVVLKPLIQIEMLPKSHLKY